MSDAAIVQPLTLLGREVREQIAGRPGWGDVKLLSTVEEEVGQLTEIGGAAAFVNRCDADSLEGARTVFFCGTAEQTRAAREGLAPGSTGVVLSTGATLDDGIPVVAGVNPGAAVRGRALLSPHPAAVLLSHLVAPLRSLGIEEAVATVVQPASLYDDPGFEELFGQVRQILTMSNRKPTAVFGTQLAFNLLPSHLAAEPVVAELDAVLAHDPPVSLQLLQGGIFHSLSASLYLRCSDRPGAKAVRRLLGQSPYVELARKPAQLGPIDAAAHDKILVGAVQEDPQTPGGFWIWAVMDNLVRGGALNALEIAEEAG